MTHIEIKTFSPTQEDIDVTLGPKFAQNRAMQERAQRMMNDASLPSVVRDQAKKDMFHYSMENIRDNASQSDTSQEVGKAALNEPVLSLSADGKIDHKKRLETIEDELRRHYDSTDPFSLSDQDLAAANADRAFSLQKADEDTKTPQEIVKLLRDVENSDRHEDATH